jgi:hypothetical protein
MVTQLFQVCPLMHNLRIQLVGLSAAVVSPVVARTYNHSKLCPKQLALLQDALSNRDQDLENA